MDKEKAPKRIYLQVAHPDHEFGVMWCPHQIYTEDVAYIREDVSDQVTRKAVRLAMELMTGLVGEQPNG